MKSMIQRIKQLLVVTGIGLAGFQTAQAGNPDRQGQAGAAQLLINGWSRSAGWGTANVAGIKGLESMYLNIAGLANTQRTEVIYSRTAWLIGTDVNINNFGIAQRLGTNGGVLGISVMSYDIGAIQITTEDQPDGGIGTFQPTMQNIAFGYSRTFSNSISGGVSARIVTEGISDVKATGVAIDAGVQYVASSIKDTLDPKKNDLHFGVSLKNVGPDMKYGGDGLARKTIDKVTGRESTTSVRAASFNLPTVLNIGASYDFRLEKDSSTYNNRLTVAANFLSSAFSNNQFCLGVEYGYKRWFAVRAGYSYEDGIFQYSTRKTALTGFTAGATVSVLLDKEHSNSSIDVDFAYRTTNPFSGCYSVGIRLNLAPLE